MTKADDLYPDYYNEMVGIAYRNAVSKNPEKEGRKCWL